MYSLVDMALYPVLFNQYLSYFVPSLGKAERWAVALAVIWSATAINLRGAFRVGRTSVIAGTFIILGFTVMAIAALPHITHTPWVPFAAPGRAGFSGLAVGLSIGLWNYIGWDNASTTQGEVRDATRTYPRALAFALPLVAAAYFVPLLPALGATDWRTWTEGGWPEIARSAAGALGRPLAIWIGLAGMMSALALFNALLLSYSRVPFVMADDGYLPRRLARTDDNGTPRASVLVSAVVYSVFVLMPFDSLVVADVLLYSLALSLEFASLVRLRQREPTLRGAFRIPIGGGAVTVLATLPMLVLVVVIVLSFYDGEFGVPALAGTAVAIVTGPLAFAVAARRLQAARATLNQPFMTNCTRCVAEMSLVGSPCTAMRSAQRPGFTLPTRFSQWSIFAFVDVAARSACTGDIP
jgi:amino acid transporter